MVENWPHQITAVEGVARAFAAGQRRVCLTSPTGGGKSRVVCQLIQDAVEIGWYAVLYSNRQLLIRQLSRVLDAAGIAHGVRAAGYAENLDAQVQVSSLPTEASRTLDRRLWELHGAGRKTFVVVDEAHLNKAGTAEKILARHHADGAYLLGVTATPVDLAHLYDTLIVAGTPPELRACGALVPAFHWAPDEPDMRRYKQSVKTGEYVEKDVVKAIMHKQVFGRVWEYYEHLNGDRRPTILFGPGVAESLWFAERFAEKGVRSAHIDGGGAWVDGEYHANADRDKILKDVQTGKIKVLCNRFVAREGLDLPEVSHLILATVFGSLQSFLQSAGRGLRAAPGKDRLTIQDHGGNWHRHGSVNVAREWDLTWTESFINGRRQDALRNRNAGNGKDGDPFEPITCGRCHFVRKAGAKCPECGYESKHKTRMVVQTDGTLREQVGDVYRPRKVSMRSNTQQLWDRMYFRAKSQKSNKTFRAAEALFFHENRYWPPRELKNMPRDPDDWFRKVAEVPKEGLIS